MDVHQEMTAREVDRTTVEYEDPLSGEIIATISYIPDHPVTLTWGPLAERDGEQHFATLRLAFRELDAEWRATCLEAQHAALAMGSPA